MSELENDKARVAALESYSILDTAEDSHFDAITSVVAELLEVPITLVSLIDEKRQWFKSHHGLDVRETPRQFAFCNHAIKKNGVFIVNDAMQDERFKENPLVQGEPKVRFYAGMPLFTPDGHGLGTLCVIDRVPRELSETQERVLSEFGKLVMGTLETHRRMCVLAGIHEQMGEEQKRKEQLAAMVVHDLRSPLSVIGLAASVGSEMTTRPELVDIFSDVLASSTHMQALLGDILDICLAESGVLVHRPTTVDLVGLIRERVREQGRAAESKNLSILMTESTPELKCQIDPMLIQRLITNLLDNAIKFSPTESVISVEVRAMDSHVEIAVSDQGNVIPTSEAEPIFAVHQQGLRAVPGTGYGLGLAFCRLAAEVHEGSIRVEERQGFVGNRFVVKLPLQGH